MWLKMILKTTFEKGAASSCVLNEQMSSACIICTCPEDSVITRLLQNLHCMHHRSINQQVFIIIIRIPYSVFRIPISISILEEVVVLPLPVSKTRNSSSSGILYKINRNSHNRSYSFWTFWAGISDSTVAKMESNSKQCIRR